LHYGATKQAQPTRDPQRVVVGLYPIPKPAPPAQCSSKVGTLMGDKYNLCNGLL
jgi:hypothetical protein